MPYSDYERDVFGLNIYKFKSNQKIVNRVFSASTININKMAAGNLECYFPKIKQLVPATISHLARDRRLLGASYCRTITPPLIRCNSLKNSTPGSDYSHKLPPRPSCLPPQCLWPILKFRASVRLAYPLFTTPFFTFPIVGLRSDAQTACNKEASVWKCLEEAAITSVIKRNAPLVIMNLSPTSPEKLS